MKKEELKALLDEKGISYKQKATNKELEALLNVSDEEVDEVTLDEDEAPSEEPDVKVENTQDEEVDEVTPSEQVRLQLIISEAKYVSPVSKTKEDKYAFKCLDNKFRSIAVFEYEDQNEALSERKKTIDLIKG